MLLAGDLGATKTLLGLFRRAPGRPTPVVVRTFMTTKHPSLVDMIESFLSEQRGRHPNIEAACFGVAGPVIDGRAELVNVGWAVDGRELADALDLGRVPVLNDLVCIAHAIEVLGPSELHTLQDGEPNPSGNAGLIAAGTGLGEAFLVPAGAHLVPAASEGGHADFAARTPRELELSAWLTARYGRAEVEAVVSGLGLRNLYDFTHETPCTALVVDGTPVDLAASVTTRGAGGTCLACREALQIFVGAYGAEAGNLALRTVATRGLYVAGGIAPKILPSLEGGDFLDAFRAKAPMRALVESIPVRVVLNPEAGLVGAAVVANAELPL
jgi:glucokinase